MADEIRVNMDIAVANGNATFKYPNGSASSTFDQAAIGGPTPGYVTIGTSEESEAFAELGTEGWCVLHNLDATNFVEWGFSTAVYGGKLEPNEKAMFRLKSTATLYLKADTAACKVFIGAFED